MEMVTVLDERSIFTFSDVELMNKVKYSLDSTAKSLLMAMSTTDES